MKPARDDWSGSPSEAFGRRRKEILTAAARIFHEKGYQATSIQDIAEAVGILKGSLYYYISSKEDLLFEVITEVHEQALRNLEQVERLEGDALAKLRLLIEAHVLNNVENLSETAVFYHDFRSLGEERRRKVIEERDVYEGFLRGLLRDGQRRGIIRDDLDPKMLAIGILGMINWLYHWYQPDGGYEPRDIARSYADLVLEGLAVPEALVRSQETTQRDAGRPT